MLHKALRFLQFWAFVPIGEVATRSEAPYPPGGKPGAHSPTAPSPPPGRRWPETLAAQAATLRSGEGRFAWLWAAGCLNRAYMREG